MPDGIPNRLPTLLWLAIDLRWQVNIRPDPDLLWVEFWRGDHRVMLTWENNRLTSCKYLRDRNGWPDALHEIPLRDVPSILRGGS